MVSSGLSKNLKTNIQITKNDNKSGEFRFNFVRHFPEHRSGMNFFAESRKHIVQAAPPMLWWRRKAAAWNAVAVTTILVLRVGNGRAEHVWLDIIFFA